MHAEKNRHMIWMAGYGYIIRYDKSHGEKIFRLSPKSMATIDYVFTLLPAGNGQIYFLHSRGAGVIDRGRLSWQFEHEIDGSDYLWLHRDGQPRLLASRSDIAGNLELRLSSEKAQRGWIMKT